MSPSFVAPQLSKAHVAHIRQTSLGRAVFLAIHAFIDKIAKDTRHRDVLLVYKKPIKQRGFERWTMGFNKIDGDTLDSLNGFSDFLQRPTPEFFRYRASEAEALLDQFKHQIFF